MFNRAFLLIIDVVLPDFINVQYSLSISSSACKKYRESVHRTAASSVITTVPADPVKPLTKVIL